MVSTFDNYPIPVAFRKAIKDGNDTEYEPSRNASLQSSLPYLYENIKYVSQRIGNCL